MTRELELAAAEQQYAHWTSVARSHPHNSPEEVTAWTLARHASMIIGQLRRQQQ